MQETAPTWDLRPLGIGGPTSSAWRKATLTRADELSFVASWILAQQETCEPKTAVPVALQNHLDAARRTADGNDENRLVRTWHAVKGSSFERALSNLDAAEVDLLRLAPPYVLKGALPSIVAHVNRFLPRYDPRRVAVDDMARNQAAALKEEQRDVLIGAQHAANTQRRRDLARLRAFRNFLFGGIVVFFLIAIVLGLIGARAPTAFPVSPRKMPPSGV